MAIFRIKNFKFKLQLVQPFTHLCITTEGTTCHTLISFVSNLSKWNHILCQLFHIMKDFRFSNFKHYEHRRLQYDLQTCFNIVHGINCLESHDFFTMSSNSKTRGHPLRLTVPIAKSNISRHFFSCRVVHPWNSLSSNLVVNPNPTNFKFRLRKVNLNKFLTQPSITFIWFCAKVLLVNKFVLLINDCKHVCMKCI